MGQALKAEGNELAYCRGLAGMIHGNTYSEDIEAVLREARRWIGRETELAWGRYPVEYEPVRRYFS